ncbi:hypothetical protein ONZ45_g6773 [Pleurotus djamor]|nr:hypothetical protein ONZ45_g6773 [Pleurotus djamor]
MTSTTTPTPTTPPSQESISPSFSQENPSHEPKLNISAENDLEASPKPPPSHPTTPNPQDESPRAITVQVPQTPQVYLTFLLVSGRRKTMSFDPELAIGRVKELVWNAWPSEWQDERPPAPSYFRILHLGKILQDDDTLSKLAFPTSLPPSSTNAAASNPNSQLPSAVPTSSSPSSPVLEPSSPTQTTHVPPAHGHQRHHSLNAHPQATIVHLSIRAYAPPTDDDLKKDKNRPRRWGRPNTNTGSVVGGVGGGDATDGNTDGVGSADRGCCGCVIC